jgi:hypothetical protein
MKRQQQFMNTLEKTGEGRNPSLFALSIRQPWTELILQGAKTIEVRTWATQYRGELWLHAGIKPDSNALQRFNSLADNLSFGALVGRCELDDCIEFTEQTWDRWRPQHLNEGDLKKQQYAWFLRNPTRISPRLMKGRLGLMRIDSADGRGMK